MQGAGLAAGAGLVGAAGIKEATSQPRRGPRVLALVGDRYHNPDYIRTGLDPVFQELGIPIDYTIAYDQISAAMLKNYQIFLTYRDGMIDVPTGPGLGIEVDRDKIRQYAELYKELGGYAYDRDPGRPDWYSVVPEYRYADPSLKDASIGNQKG